MDSPFIKAFLNNYVRVFLNLFIIASLKVFRKALPDFFQVFLNYFLRVSKFSLNSCLNLNLTNLPCSTFTILPFTFSLKALQVSIKFCLNFLLRVSILVSPKISFILDRNLYFFQYLRKGSQS